MWKRSNALSWPILIAREAWSYNLKTWRNLRLMVVLKHDNVVIPIWVHVNHMDIFTSSNLLQTPHENETATQHFCWWKPSWVKTSVIPVMLGGHSGLDPPLPISNRAVKRTSANDSMHFACESRSLPSYLFIQTSPLDEGFLFLYPSPENLPCGGFLVSYPIKAAAF